MTSTLHPQPRSPSPAVADLVFRYAMLRTLIIACVCVLGAADVALSQSSGDDSKRIVGEWLDSRSGKATIFHANGSWGVQRADDIPEEIHGRWWIKRGKLFMTYTSDDGVGTPVHHRIARESITFAGNDRFTTESGGYKTVYDRYR